jgi:RluA family pseudouridine synthase
MPIEILFQGSDIIAVNKPVGLAAIPGQGQETDLLNELSRQIGSRLYVVHRLDKETSGVIIFAKGPDIHRYLNGLLENHLVGKTYLALVCGQTLDKGKIKKPLRQFGSGRTAVDLRKGKPALTEFETFRRFKNYTLVKVRPASGRRHQIRAHFYSIGHPIAGDTVYGKNPGQAGFNRLMLHSLSIEFSLPDGTAFKAEAPTPESFECEVRKLI